MPHQKHEKHERYVYDFPAVDTSKDTNVKGFFYYPYDESNILGDAVLDIKNNRKLDIKNSKITRHHRKKPDDGKILAFGFAETSDDKRKNKDIATILPESTYEYSINQGNGYIRKIDSSDTKRSKFYSEIYFDSKRPNHNPSH